MTVAPLAGPDLPINERSHPSAYRLLKQVMASKPYAPRDAMAQCLHDLDRCQRVDIETQERHLVRTSAGVLPPAPGCPPAEFLASATASERDQIPSRRGPVRQVLAISYSSGYLSARRADATQGWRLALLHRREVTVDFVQTDHLALRLDHCVSSAQANLAKFPAADVAFDLVIAAEVLEHGSDADGATAMMHSGSWLAVSLPIILGISRHPIVFASERGILAFFERLGLKTTGMATMRSDLRMEAIAEVFPYFADCVNAVFHKPTEKT